MAMDANALIPPRLSDMLFDLHREGFFQPRWTVDVEREFKSNYPSVVFSKNREEQKAIKSHPEHWHAEAAKKRLRTFKSAAGPEHPIYGHDLPEILNKVPSAVDSKDRHVVAAALVVKKYSEANDRVVLLSANLVDLAVSEMAKLRIEVLSPGQFLNELATLDLKRFIKAMGRTIGDLRSGSFSESDLLDCLRQHKAKKAAALLAKSWNIQNEEPQQIPFL